MSKVGILSMQRIKNYGSFLQAYALKTLIEDLGHEVQFADYHVEKPVIKMKKNAKHGSFSKILQTMEGDAPFVQKMQYMIHKKNFGKKYYKILGLTEDFNYNPKLDTLVIGSDEVFNCIQSNTNVGFSTELFGKNHNAKNLISYAASFGNTTISKLKKYGKFDEIKRLIEKFDNISVRDTNSGKIINEMTEKNIYYNLDPVLAYDYVNDCNKIPKLNTNDKFMIVYAYSNRISKEESKYIKEFAKKNKLKVYAIGGAQNCADKFIDCSPFEVLAYFKNAEIIVTDTFHGSIFSIINKKKFVTIVRKSIGSNYGNEEKLTDLLCRLKLEDRIIYNIFDLEKIGNMDIDYSDTDKILKEERVKTKNYLKKSIR